MNMQTKINLAIEQISQLVIGKQRQIKLAISCLIANGHLLVEDLPGMGKTTLSHALAEVLGLNFSRVQFTSDLLPADVLGLTIFDSSKQSFNFHPGPIFSQVVLADEINRASPKTQSLTNPHEIHIKNNKIIRKQSEHS
jgi:MoxR-like ATPase